jgi:hypothetical protein
MRNLDVVSDQGSRPLGAARSKPPGSVRGFFFEAFVKSQAAIPGG